LKLKNTKYDRHERRGFLLKLLNCASCKREFPLPLEREDHAKYSDDCLIECSYEGCNFRVSQFQDILLHMTNNHDINLKNTIRRMEALAGRSVEPQKCRICEAVFRGVSEIQVHFKDNHPDQHPFECDLCGHRAIDGSRLKRHLMCHEPDRPREYCNICFKEFRNKVSLRTHRNMVHKLGKQYPCSYCGKILYSSQYVKKHEATHTGQKFKGVNCKYCGKLVEYTKLKNHELTHTGEKPFKCSDCPYRCIQRSNLRIHMRAVHKKELPRLAVGQKRYSGVFMDGTVANNDPFDLRSVFHQKIETEK